MTRNTAAYASNPHEIVERRSVALHSAVAALILGDPTLIDRTRQRVAQWLVDGSVAQVYAERWSELLELPAAELAELLTAETEEMCALRQVSPFAGVLPPRQRWDILRRVGSTSG